MEVPLPKFKVGDKVFHVEWNGEITERQIEEVQWELMLCNNGFVNFAEYEIRYKFTNEIFWDFIKKEEDIFKDKLDAITLSIERRVELEVNRKKQKNERIKQLTDELNKLLNDKEN